ncbi:hypothetical protein [Ideonella sp. BN130291]|uniref:hypothetical protein n=1 Tax=Ideonella sp. BN130291 TaxID=3112940 RepID=UPI002E2648C5|nr:hypothetical protein [Ideonella sp. BN130291]
MTELFEMFPFAFGVLLGFTWARMGGPQSRRIAWALSCMGLGAFATFASGEWRESLLYVLFDVGLVAMVSIAVALGLAYWRGRHHDA